MLVISRKLGDSFRIGNDIMLTVIGVRDESARIGIDAPKVVEILREEIYQGVQSQLLYSEKILSSE